MTNEHSADCYIKAEIKENLKQKFEKFVDDYYSEKCKSDQNFEWTENEDRVLLRMSNLIEVMLENLRQL